MQTTGYVRDIPNEADWLYGALQPVTALPARCSYESLIGPAFDQGETTQCVCYSAAGLKRFHEWRQTGQWLTFDPADLYAQCKAIDGVPDAPGTYPRVAMDILRKVGMLASDGKRYKIQNSTRQTSVDGIKTAIYKEGPVLIGVRVDVNALTQISGSEILDLTDSLGGGHCMLIVGYDDGLQAFRVRNSWSEKYADSGHFWMPYDYLSKVDPHFDAWSSFDEVDAH